MSSRLKLDPKVSQLVMLGIIVMELLLFAPIIPYQARVPNRTIIPVTEMADCQTAKWNVYVNEPGWIDVDVQSYAFDGSELLRVVIRDPFGDTFLNQIGVSVKALLPSQPLLEGYDIVIENPGTTCDGNTIQIYGKIEFWHEETRWRRLLAP